MYTFLYAFLEELEIQLCNYYYKLIQFVQLKSQNTGEGQKNKFIGLNSLDCIFRLGHYFAVSASSLSFFLSNFYIYTYIFNTQLMLFSMSETN